MSVLEMMIVLRVLSLVIILFDSLSDCMMRIWFCIA